MWSPSYLWSIPVALFLLVALFPSLLSSALIDMSTVIDSGYLQCTYAGVINPKEHSDEVQHLIESEIYSINDCAGTDMSSPSTTVTARDSGWISRCTALDVLLVRYQKKFEMLEARNENQNSLFKPSYVVFS